ncbi:glycosyltransferase family 2 protein [Sphingomonas sp. Leaf62]|uniref:glycosyltransferase family 2 protein n=1 Tax=Sphingomonas sp. Leaf62 TaxID=1736228 RepID=UPI000ABAB162|nr:glycosyltransferase family 2 protein [Sphingomonas sp. Leaf62]
MSDVVPALQAAVAKADYDTAYRLYESHATDLDGNIVARNLHAETLFAQGDTEAALSLLHETQTRSPSDVRAPLELGKMYLRLHDKASALGWFERAAAVAPANMWSYYHIAQIHRRHGDFAAEVDILRRGERHCHGRVLAAEYQAILKELASARTLLAVQPLSGYEVRLAPPAAEAPELPGCVHVTMAKDEGDVIYACLAASHRQGFRKFMIADNGSTDNTADEIRRFAADHPSAITFIVSDPVVGYYQDVKTMALVDYAARVFAGIGSPIRWAFPIDADEELQAFDSEASLRQIVDHADRQDAKMIVFAWSHAASVTALQRFEPEQDLHRSFPCRSRFGPGLVRKCAFRIDGVAMVEMGAHFIRDCADREADMVIAAEHGFAMIHYAVRSVEQAKRKTVNGYNALKAATGMEGMGSHWRSDYEKFVALGDVFFQQKVEAYIDRVKRHTI